MTSSIEQLLPFLRCPATQSPLVLDVNGSLQTLDHSRSYRMVNGVPILLAAERSLIDPAVLTSNGTSDSKQQFASSRRLASPVKQWIFWALRLPPTASRSVGTRENYRLLRSLLRNHAQATDDPVRVLVVGGGEIGIGAAELVSDPAFDVVETDIYVSARTRVVCDGHDLPFVDASFDAVICQAVLEHVIDPWRVAGEIRRVLKPEGLVYSEIPFMQQVHGGAFDFTRFTLLGHRRLWRDFDEIRAGAQGGPGMALIWGILHFFRALLPLRLWKFSDRLVTLGFFWLKYFDGYLVGRPAGQDAASGTFFLGRRRRTPLDDRAIVAGYRGAVPRPIWSRG